MYVCIYIYIYTHICVYIYIYIHMCMYISIYSISLSIYIYIYTHVYVYVCVYIYIYIYIYIYTCTRDPYYEAGIGRWLTNPAPNLSLWVNSKPLKHKARTTNQASDDTLPNQV